MKIMAQLLIWVIRGYQILLSPFFGQQCRFYPTCSAYATQAINRHGVIKGGYYALRRILRCHPWHVGGSDPIP
jgi:putative membrane protein insertion efficiency factor